VITPQDANIDGLGTKVVGSYKPNAFGLNDMHGNVWEWCQDWMADYPEGAAMDPKGPATGNDRVLRGGSFFLIESHARSSYRGSCLSFKQVEDSGFRLARTVDVKAAIAPTEPKPDPTEIMSTKGNLLVSPFTEAKAKEVQKEVAKILKKEVDENEDLGKGIKLEMVLIPAGKFKMGSPASEKGRQPTENQHEVTLTKPYYIGKYEVTQDQWQEVMANNPSKTKGEKLPVTDISWNDCQEFIKKLNSTTNGGYRLPTEAEWEYACRAGTTDAYSFGDSLKKGDSNCLTKGDPNSGGGAAGNIKLVGSYSPNAFGLHDMHGNVFEWCEDWFGAYPSGLVTDPKGPPTGDPRVLRGGAFTTHVIDARSSYRPNISPTYRSFSVGFRLARTP